MKLVIFDCDGVLINSEDLLAEAETELLAELGMSYTPAERSRLLIGVSHKDHIVQVEGDYRRLKGRDLPADFWTRLVDRDRELKATRLRAIDGLTSVLDFLDAMQMPFAVASNTHLPSLHQNLETAGLRHRFMPHIYSRDHVERGKPAPDLYLYAAAQRGVDPVDCLVVEDSVTGVTAAVAAGMKVYGFTGGYEKYIPDGAPLLAAGAQKTVARMNDLLAEFQTRLAPPGSHKTLKLP